MTHLDCAGAGDKLGGAMQVREATIDDAEVLTALRHEFRAALEAPTEAEPGFLAGGA